jgi:hypothetical protein
MDVRSCSLQAKEPDRRSAARNSSVYFAKTRKKASACQKVLHGYLVGADDGKDLAGNDDFNVILENTRGNPHSTPGPWVNDSITSRIPNTP